MKDDLDVELLKKIAYVSVSSYRLRTVKALHNEVKIPTQIAKDTEILPNHISKILTELKNENIAECINEESRKGRLYRLTPFGEEVAENLDKF
ncbi:transcriptional regulator [Methanobrevibacter sp.]|uniref:transcriptional regulator n=1 Tax=Methanobrevibacter sp. TaxID=66852 RepID=UPI00388F4A02